MSTAATAVMAAPATTTNVSPAAQPAITVCEHIKDNGIRCGSPAIRGRHFCYFHSRAHHPVGRFGHRNYRSPVADTVESLQVAMTHVMQALSTGDVPPKQANSMLFAINLATNLLRVPKPQSESEKSVVVTEIPQAMQEFLSPAPEPEHEPSSESPAPREVSEATFNRLTSHLMTPDQITEIRPALLDGENNPGYAAASRLISAHYDAARKLNELGITRQNPRLQKWFPQKPAQV